MVLNRVFRHVSQFGCGAVCIVVDYGCVEVDWIPETCELDAWFSDAHGPGHAFDGDFTNSSGKFVVFDLAVVVVVSAVDLCHLIGVEMVDDVLGDEWCEDILVLVAL